MPGHQLKFILSIFALLFALDSDAEIIEIVDDIGRPLRLTAPAKRIISLAPHITENLFAAGAGDLIIGAVSYSDFPEQARIIPRVGSYNNINIELILALHPDLIIGWKEGNQKQQVEQLINLGLTVYINAPVKLADIARNIQDFGILTGNENSANKASIAFTVRLNSLREKYSEKKAISVFYQTWHKPLLTVNDQQIIGRILTLCGGRNIFADLSTLTPRVNIEAVLSHNPRAIIASGMGEARPEWLDIWRIWPSLKATRDDNLFFVPPDIIQRSTPRLLDGAQLICKYLQQARDNEE